MLQRILGSGRDRVFLISEPILTWKDLVLTGDLRRVILTLQYTYTIHTIILSPYENRSNFLWILILWISWCIWFQPPFQSVLNFHLDSYIHLDSSLPDVVSWAGHRRESMAEIRVHSGIMVLREAMWEWEDVVILSGMFLIHGYIFINLNSFLFSLPYWNFKDEIFVKVGRM